MRLEEGVSLVTPYWGGGEGGEFNRSRHFLVLTLYNFKNIGVGVGWWHVPSFGRTLNLTEQ